MLFLNHKCLIVQKGKQCQKLERACSMIIFYDEFCFLLDLTAASWIENANLLCLIPHSIINRETLYDIS